MKVFISWSGDLSREVAKELKSWATPILQSVDFWLSSHDISAGQRWFDRISRELDDINFGMVCLTRQNVKAPWVNFEAGALAKSIEAARVVPVYVNLNAVDVTGPLSNFQGVQLNREGIHSLVHDVNAATDRPVPDPPLDGLFDAMWPQLEAKLNEARNKFTELDQEEVPARSAESMFGEVLGRIRRIEAKVDDEDTGRRMLQREESSMRVLEEINRLLSRLDEIHPAERTQAMEDAIERIDRVLRHGSGDVWRGGRSGSR
ncbi:hypothetical protein GCM10023205_61370 [Yinghuangia aomiensis]|uniref:TIR domain-containing protein n=1 Tax=Yinghuangia aomiensis TaxID=676205 RepID=A0ABP9HZV5_9ACTN